MKIYPNHQLHAGDADSPPGNDPIGISPGSLALFRAIARRCLRDPVLRLAVLVQYRLATDRQTDGRTDRHIYDTAAYTALA